MRYSHSQGALAGKDFWSLPGGELEKNETFQDAARRELFEETGIICHEVGERVAVREFDFLLPDGERVIAEEHFFRIHVDSDTLTREHLTSFEKEIVSEFRWWPIEHLRTTGESVYPSDLVALLDAPSTENGRA